MTNRMAVIGGGAWGTALAATAVGAGNAVTLWARNPHVVSSINAGKGNPLYLPAARLDPAIRATGDLAVALERADIILLVTPAQAVRATCRALRPLLVPGQVMVICAKGIELATTRLMSEVTAEELPDTVLAVLSGPTFAAEVAAGLPTAVTLACGDAATGERLIHRLGRPTFRPYLSADLVGAEIGGAVKNVLAIACGIVAGRRLGDNARAALITRGLAEMLRFGIAKGAHPETLMGLSGLGDLVLTCTGPQSRNMSLGLALGEGKSLAEIMASRRTVAEGVPTATAVVAAAGQMGVEMPICAAVDAILNHGAAIDSCIAALLARPFKAESLSEAERRD